MVDALIIDACRTPRGIGKAGKGALAGIHPKRVFALGRHRQGDRYQGGVTPFLKCMGLGIWRELTPGLDRLQMTPINSP